MTNVTWLYGLLAWVHSSAGAAQRVHSRLSKQHLWIMQRTSAATASTASRQSKKAKLSIKKCTIPHIDDDDDNDDVSYEISQSVYKTREDKFRNYQKKNNWTTEANHRTVNSNVVCRNVVWKVWYTQTIIGGFYGFRCCSEASYRCCCGCIRLSIQEKIVAAVYVDNERRNNRATSFIVSGLKPPDIRPDQQAIIDLCRIKFGETIDIVHCKWIGKQVTSRTQSSSKPSLMQLASSQLQETSVIHLIVRSDRESTSQLI